MFYVLGQCILFFFYGSSTKYREHNVTNQSIDLIVFLGLSMGTFLFLLDLVIELLLWLTSFRESCTMSLVKRADQLSWVLYDVPCKTSCLWLSWLSYHLQNDVYLFHLRIKCFLIYVLWEHIKTLNQEPYMHLKLIKLSEPRLLAAWNIYHYFICRIQHFWLQFIAFSHGPFIDITDKKFVNWTLRITSVHGQTAQLPFIKSVEVNFLCHAIVHIFFWNHSLKSLWYQSSTMFFAMFWFSLNENQGPQDLMGMFYWIAFLWSHVRSFLLSYMQTHYTC